MSNADNRGDVAPATCEQRQTADIKAEEKHGFAAARLREIIDRMPSFLWAADPNGEPTQVSQRALDYSGTRLEDVEHGGWEAFIRRTTFQKQLEPSVTQFSTEIARGRG